MRIRVSFLWVPTHVGVKGNEEPDTLAKEALKEPDSNITVKMSKAETKGLISTIVKKNWQRIWENEVRGRHMSSIQGNVGVERRTINNRKKDVTMTRLWIGHTTLNQSLYTIWKHETSKCDNCRLPETVKHVLLECTAYNRERLQLLQALKEWGVRIYSLMDILGDETDYRIHRELFRFLNARGLVNRI